MNHGAIGVVNHTPFYFPETPASGSPPLRPQQVAPNEEPSKFQSPVLQHPDISESHRQAFALPSFSRLLQIQAAWLLPLLNKNNCCRRRNQSFPQKHASSRQEAPLNRVCLFRPCPTRKKSAFEARLIVPKGCYKWKKNFINTAFFLYCAHNKHF